MWVTTPALRPADAIDALRAAMAEADQLLRTGQLEVVTHDEWYLRDGVFDAEQTLAAWGQKAHLATLRGYDGLRVAGDTFWLEPAQWSDFIAYEKSVTDAVRGSRMLALCTYASDRCGLAELIDVLAAHQFAVVRQRDEWIIVESSRDLRPREREYAELGARLSRSGVLRDKAVEDLSILRDWIADDLRGPVRAIGAHAASLERAAPADAAVSHDVGQIKANVSTVDKIIAEMLQTVSHPAQPL